MKRTVAVLTLLFTFSLIAFAHGKEKHVMGTVTNISENSITVETTSKKSVTVELNDKTNVRVSLGWAKTGTVHNENCGMR